MIDTNLVRYDINANGTESAEIDHLTVFGSTLYFCASDGTASGGHGRELWSYTAAGGAALVADLNTEAHTDGGTVGSGVGPLTVLGANAYFRATSTTSTAYDYELWSYDGASTPSFFDIVAGDDGSSPTNMVTMGTNLYFSARETGSTDNNNELWVYDGSASPTVGVNIKPVFEINSATGQGSFPEDLTVYENRLYFEATDGDPAGSGNGYQLWEYDGTDSPVLGLNIRPIVINPSGDSHPGGFYVYNNRLVFHADNGTDGREMWTLFIK